MGLCEFRAAPGAAGGRLTGAEHGGQTGAQMAPDALWRPVGPSSFSVRLTFRRATSGPTGVPGWRGKPFFLPGGEACLQLAALTPLRSGSSAAAATAPKESNKRSSRCLFAYELQ